MDLLKRLEPLLECPVCTESLMPGNYQLNCQHVICKRCLWRLAAMSQTIRCPMCRQSVDEPLEGLKPSILVDAVASALIDFERTSENKPRQGRLGKPVSSLSFAKPVVHQIERAIRYTCQVRLTIAADGRPPGDLTEWMRSLCMVEKKEIGTICIRCERLFSSRCELLSHHEYCPGSHRNVQLSQLFYRCSGCRRDHVFQTQEEFRKHCENPLGL